MEEPLLSGPTNLPEGGLAVDMQQKPQHLYPDSFYCPLTEKVMTDPVVGAGGISYERSAVLERDRTDTTSQEQQQILYYPNRALKIMIDKEKQIEMEQGTVRGALRKAEESLRAGLDQVLEKSALQKDGYRPLPDPNYCPITLDIMLHPAIDPDGNTYERRAIRSWVRRNGNSPLTRNKMNMKQLRDNNALENLIALEANKPENSNDPSIQRWKEARKNEEDEENRIRDLHEEMDESEVEETGPSPASPEEVDNGVTLREYPTFFFAVFTLMVLWCAVVFIPLNTLVYIVMGLLIGGLNVVLIEYFQPRSFHDVPAHW